MTVEVQARIGPSTAADGTLITPRAGREGALVTHDLHPRYYESTYRGKVFTASISTAGVAPGTVLSTTPPFILYNPTGSGINAVLLATALGYISGTLGAGTIVYAQAAQASAAPTGGTALTVRSAMIGNNNAASSLAYTGATVAATPALIRPAFILSAFLASTATAPIPPIVDVIDGRLILTPGNVFVMQAVAAGGSTPLVLLSADWEEVPI